MKNKIDIVDIDEKLSLLKSLHLNAEHGADLEYWEQRTSFSWLLGGTSFVIPESSSEYSNAAKQRYRIPQGIAYLMGVAHQELYSKPDCTVEEYANRLDQLRMRMLANTTVSRWRHLDTSRTYAQSIVAARKQIPISMPVTAPSPESMALTPNQIAENPASEQVTRPIKDLDKKIRLLNVLHLNPEDRIHLEYWEERTPTGGCLFSIPEGTPQHDDAEKKSYNIPTGVANLINKGRILLYSDIDSSIEEFANALDKVRTNMVVGKPSSRHPDTQRFYETEIYYSNLPGIPFDEITDVKKIDIASAAGEIFRA